MRELLHPLNGWTVGDDRLYVDTKLNKIVLTLMKSLTG